MQMRVKCCRDDSPWERKMRLYLDISHYLIEVQWHHAVKIGFACKNKTLLNDTHDDDDCGCAGGG